MKNYKEINKDILKALPNPSKREYTITMNIPELTFIGAYEQPDFGKLTIELVPDKLIVELKSLKLYVYQLRDIFVSYERLIEVIFNHLQEIYAPVKLIVILETNPRGGISSVLRMESK